MIIVIADDFTGAAEISGIGFNHGLKVVVQTNMPVTNQADMVVIVANTRSMDVTAAEEKIREISNSLVKLKPTFIFKKIDSVMRGNVLAELKAQMEVMKLADALVIAGNPALGRVIKDGKFLVNGIPLSETGFGKDPHFPAHSSDVLEVLKSGGKGQLVNSKPTRDIPSGIVVGDVTNEEDLEIWASTFDSNRLYAGAANYFDSLLTANNIKSFPGRSGFPFGNHVLYVEGTSYPKNEEFTRKMTDKGVCFSDIPDEIYSNKNFHPDLLDEWADTIKEKLENQNVYVTMRKKGSKEAGISERLCRNIGEVIWKVTAGSVIDELLIEGGDTAAIILDLLKIRKLRPVQVYSQGVIRMEVIGNRNFYVTTKPGSYEWPEQVLVGRQVQPA